MTRLPTLILGTASAVLLAAFATTSLAQTSDNPDVVLSADDAIAIALAAQPGTIGEAELDAFDGKPAYDIEVVNASGEEIEFKIDAATGDILNKWTDDNPADDPAPGASEETTN